MAEKINWVKISLTLDKSLTIDKSISLLDSIVTYSLTKPKISSIVPLTLITELPSETTSTYKTLSKYLTFTVASNPS